MKNWFWKTKSNFAGARRFALMLGLFICLQPISLAAAPYELSETVLPKPQLQLLAEQLYQKECLGQERYLTHWNTGESFASFGIGHFIWFPQKALVEGVPFNQTFPQMVRYVDRYQPMPNWLKRLAQQPHFNLPWQTKAEFDQAWSNSNLRELRDWLAKTHLWQAQFVVTRFDQQWQQALAALPLDQQETLLQAYQSLKMETGGLFALMDYSHFKGMGANSKEQYQGQGWGLVEVLSKMSAPYDLLGFKKAAIECLRLRVKNAPQHRQEGRWLQGWENRIRSY